jgi:hypothetical protein
VPQTYKIDQAATFAGVALLSVEPKVAFGSTEQDRTSDGVPKWEAQLVAGFHQFGKINNEILKVGVVAHTNLAMVWRLTPRWSWSALKSG